MKLEGSNLGGHESFILITKATIQINSIKKRVRKGLLSINP